MSPNDVWAITCYFNPARFWQRRINYRMFRHNLNLRLLTVELSFNGEFELEAGDADRLIQLRDGDILWQKERLLNIAASALPASCAYVAWLDCDVVFGDDRWPMRARETLQRAKLVQLFSRVIDLPKGVRTVPARASRVFRGVRSTMYAAHCGGDMTRSLRYPEHRSTEATANGLAWAARREFFDAAALYDACILGSGDRALACALLQIPEVLVAALKFHPEHATHYLSWAKTVSDWVGGAHSALEGEIFHLWHGWPERRLLSTRYTGLHDFEFDPRKDIELYSNQVWRWASRKAAMHTYVREYFQQRMEDGSPSEVRGALET